MIHLKLKMAHRTIKTASLVTLNIDLQITQIMFPVMLIEFSTQICQVTKGFLSHCSTPKTYEMLLIFPIL